MGDALLFPVRSYVLGVDAWEFDVAGKPVAWSQEHFGRYLGRKGGKHRVGVETPLTTASENYQTRIGRAAHLAIPDQLDGPLRVCVVFVHPRAGKCDKAGPGRMVHAVAPDIDKCLRNVLDGLQRSPAGRAKPYRHSGPWPGAIKSDARVASTRCDAFYAAKNEEPHTEVRVERLR